MLSDSIPKLIMQGRYGEAEAILSRAHKQATEANDVEALENIVAHMVHLYCSLDPPDLVRAEKFSREREQVKGSAHNKLQTAMMLYYVASDYERAVHKLRDAIASGRTTDDHRTVYSSLSLLGQALLELQRPAEAVEVLREVEQMISDRKPVVVGDETSFLESVKARGIEVAAAKRIAASLIPICRDPEFVRRLRALVAN